MIINNCHDAHSLLAIVPIEKNVGGTNNTTLAPKLTVTMAEQR